MSNVDSSRLDDVSFSELSDEEMNECLALLFDPAETEGCQTVETRLASWDHKNHYKATSRSSSSSSACSVSSASDESSCESDSSYSVTSSQLPQTSTSTTKVDKATARKIANRESAKNSYLKKKEYVRSLENENAKLKEEVIRLREEGQRMRKVMLAMQEKHLLLEDVGVGNQILGGTGEGGGQGDCSLSSTMHQQQQHLLLLIKLIPTRRRGRGGGRVSRWTLALV